jgi:hypothetical protein
MWYNTNAHRACKRLVPKPRGSQSVRGFAFIPLSYSEAGKASDRYSRIWREHPPKTNRAYGRHFP